MIRALLSCLMVLALAAGTCLGETAKADAAYGVRYVQERVVDLPQDDYKPYLTVFGKSTDPRYQELVKSFEQNPTLKAIKDQTHFNAISTDGVMFSRYAHENPAALAVKFQAVNDDKETYTTIVHLVGDQIPMSADALAKALNREARSAECFRRQRQIIINNENNNNLASPEVDPEPQPLSPSKPPVKPAKEVPHWPGVVLAIAGFCVGGVLGLRKWWAQTYPK